MYVKDFIDKIVKEVNKYVVGRDEEIKLILLTMLIEGHVLIYGLPGTAKTMIAKLIAQALGLQFSRIQFLPDILPSDVVGAKIVDPKTGELRTVIGPIYANIVLADEINRGSPRALSALIEAMQEGHITIEGDRIDLPKPFIVLATLNPVELHGIFPIPLAILDRFTISIKFNYSEKDDEISMLLKDQGIDLHRVKLNPVIEFKELEKAFNDVRKTRVTNDIAEYTVNIVHNLRVHEKVSIGPSPRATLHLLRFARALAAYEDRDYVIPDDIKRAAIPVLRHRIVPRIQTSSLLETLTLCEDIIQDVLEKTEPPI